MYGRAMPSSLYSTGPCPEACTIDSLILRAGCVGKDGEQTEKKEHNDDEEEEEEEEEEEGEGGRARYSSEFCGSFFLDQKAVRSVDEMSKLVRSRTDQDGPKALGRSVPRIS